MIFKPTSDSADPFYECFEHAIHKLGSSLNGINSKSSPKELIEYLNQLNLSPGLQDYNLRQYVWHREHWFSHPEIKSADKIVVAWIGSEQQLNHHIEYSRDVVLNPKKIITMDHVMWNYNFVQRTDGETDGIYRFTEGFREKMIKQKSLLDRVAA